MKKMSEQQFREAKKALVASGEMTQDDLDAIVKAKPADFFLKADESGEDEDEDDADLIDEVVKAQKAELEAIEKAAGDAAAMALATKMADPYPDELEHNLTDPPGANPSPENRLPYNRKTVDGFPETEDVTEVLTDIVKAAVASFKDDIVKATVDIVRHYTKLADEKAENREKRRDEIRKAERATDAARIDAIQKAQVKAGKRVRDEIRKAQNATPGPSPFAAQRHQGMQRIAEPGEKPPAKKSGLDPDVIAAWCNDQIEGVMKGTRGAHETTRINKLRNTVMALSVPDVTDADLHTMAVEVGYPIPN